MPAVRAPAPAHLPAATAVLAALDDPVILMVAAAPGAWRIAWVNDAYERVTGFRADEVIGTTPGNLLGPLSDPDLVAKAEADYRAGDGSAVRVRCILHARDGSPLLCDLEAGALPATEDGLELGWAVLRIQDYHYRVLLENISDVVAVLDGEGIVRYASPSIRVLGFDDPSTVLGTSVFEYLEPAHQGDHAATLARVLSTPGVYGPWPLTLHDPSGHPHPVEVVLNNRLDDPAVRGVVVTARSAEERIAAEEALARRERRFRTLVQRSSDFVILLDRAGVCRYASPAVERALGHAIEGLPFDDSGLPELVPDGVAERLGEVLATPGSTVPVETQVALPGGAMRWLQITATNLLDDPDVEGLLIHGRDITDRKRTDRLLAAELGVLETMATSHSVVPVLRKLAETAEMFFPGARCAAGVLDSDGVIRHPAAPNVPAALVALLDAEPPDGELGRTIRQTEEWLVCEDITTDPAWGAMGPIARHHGLRACWWFPLHGADGLLGVLAIFLPQTRRPHPAELPLLERLRHLARLALERSRFDARLRQQALHDALTDLPNRTLLLDRVDQALQLSERRGSHTAVLFVDLDNFKIVNDSLGHAKGDELLRKVADRFAASVRRGDTVGRFGGDEFLVVAEDVAGEAGAVAAAERLMRALAQPFEIDGAQVAVNASIGIALAGPGTDPAGADALVRNADAAMYRAKDRGRNQISVFEETLHAELVRRYELEQGLRTALDRDELVVLYQPRVRLSDGRLTGVEALLRWERPGHGLIGADEVVPIAEETGLIVPIGAHVLRTACSQAVSWDDDPATAGLTVAVNLSARQLADPGLEPLVASTLQATGLAAHRLCLEVTESALSRDPESASAVLASLKRLGVHLAIDDFGTGYATLDYVRRYSMADELKIDRSFVAGLDDPSSADGAIVSAAIVLADTLGFETVAEGVERREQVTVLRRLGCAAAQGWYFGPPVPPDRIR